MKVEKVLVVKLETGALRQVAPAEADRLIETGCYEMRDESFKVVKKITEKENEKVPPKVKEGRLMKEFIAWADNFKNSPEGEATLLLVDDHLVDAGPPYDPVIPMSNWLKERILKSCFKAKMYMDKLQEPDFKDNFKKHKETQGKIPEVIKSIKNIRYFLKEDPYAAYLISAFSTFKYRDDISLCRRSDKKNTDPHVLLEKIFESFQSSLEEHGVPDGLLYRDVVGCMRFPRHLTKILKPAIDSLIFDLAFLIRLYISDGEMVPWAAGLPLPEVKSFYMQNEIIAYFVSATFKEDVTDSMVGQRIDYFVKEKVCYVGWDLSLDNKVIKEINSVDFSIDYFGVFDSPN